MAEVKKVARPAVTASSRPCAFVSPDKGNAPTITPVRARAEADTAPAEQRKESTSA
ncbi:hypothetical protein KUM39_07265 [Streptomyces sp. J2-1]|uniref:hypothetical protein n=1 Tax=Streptomyces corallincola TaxID=2851888 RepID=UPI001C3896F1|nr:hypothetical protein [Streptomyces corallincola]MBV2354163.1 hypothetical protein [Streptomyces corallincola]